jgi:methionine aminopeptidase
MKTILIVLVGVLVWTNNDARSFTSKALYRAAEFVSPESETRSIGETIDEIFTR